MQKIRLAPRVRKDVVLRAKAKASLQNKTLQQVIEDLLIEWSKDFAEIAKFEEKIF